MLLVGRTQGRAASGRPPLLFPRFVLGQRVRRHDNAVVIGVEKVARYAGEAGELYGDAFLAGAVEGRPHGTVAEGLYTDTECGQHVDVSHRSVDDDALPTVGQSLGGELIAQERTSQRPASIDDQHLAPTILDYQLADAGVVFVAFDGGDLSPEARNPTVAAKHGIGDL